MSDVFTLMGGRDWMKGLPVPLSLDGPATRDAVRFQVPSGKANRIGVKREVDKSVAVYFVRWYRFDTDNGEADELRVEEATTARGAAALIEASLKGKAVKARPEPAEV